MCTVYGLDELQQERLTDVGRQKIHIQPVIHLCVCMCITNLNHLK